MHWPPSSAGRPTAIWQKRGVAGAHSARRRMHFPFRLPFPKPGSTSRMKPRCGNGAARSTATRLNSVRLSGIRGRSSRRLRGISRGLDRSPRLPGVNRSMLSDSHRRTAREGRRGCSAAKREQIAPNGDKRPIRRDDNAPSRSPTTSATRPRERRDRKHAPEQATDDVGQDTASPADDDRSLGHLSAHAMPSRALGAARGGSDARSQALPGLASRSRPGVLPRRARRYTSSAVSPRSVSLDEAEGRRDEPSPLPRLAYFAT